MTDDYREFMIEWLVVLTGYDRSYYEKMKPEELETVYAGCWATVSDEIRGRGNV